MNEGSRGTRTKTESKGSKASQSVLREAEYRIDMRLPCRVIGAGALPSKHGTACRTNGRTKTRAGPRPRPCCARQIAAEEKEVVGIMAAGWRGLE